jgi:hypothetical protein
MYIDAVAALYRNGGAGERSARDGAYMNAMAAVYAKTLPPPNQRRHQDLLHARALSRWYRQGSDLPQHIRE